MNYKDLQNIASLSNQILTESATQEHDALNRWPYTSPYLQEATEVSEERAPGVKPYGGGKEVGDNMRAGYGIKITPKPPSGKKGDASGYGAPEKFNQDTDKNSFNPGVDIPAVKKFNRISRSIPHGIGDHANKTQSRVSTIVRKDPGAPTSQKLPPPDKKKPNKAVIRRKPEATSEEYDLYDVILSHLLDEGYADTQEAAEAIMVNMSEDWRESIFEEFEQLNEISDKKVAGLLRARDRRDIDTGAPTREFFQSRNAQQAAARRNARTGSNVKVDPILSKP